MSPVETEPVASEKSTVGTETMASEMSPAGTETVASELTPVETETVASEPSPVGTEAMASEECRVRGAWPHGGHWRVSNIDFRQKYTVSSLQIIPFILQ